MEQHQVQEALGVKPPRDAEDALHLWWCCGEVSFDRTDWLSEAELTHCAAYRFEHLRRAFRVRRSFLRAVLAAYVGGGPEEIRFREGEHGKPYLAGEGSDLYFNLSFSEERVLIGVSRVAELGVDVQKHLALANDLESMARQVMTAEEHALFEAAPTGEHVERFYQLWTRKEAVLKASGLGLYREPNTFAVGHGPGGLSHPVFASKPDAWDGVRSLCDIESPVTYSAAVASSEEDLPSLLVARAAP